MKISTNLITTSIQSNTMLRYLICRCNIRPSMTVDIRFDPEGNSNFKALDIPVGIGRTSVRVLGSQADDIATTIESVDLVPFIAEVEQEPDVPESEYAFRSRVVEKAVKRISQDLTDKTAEANKDVIYDGLG